VGVGKGFGGGETKKLVFEFGVWNENENDFFLIYKLL